MHLCKGAVILHYGRKTDRLMIVSSWYMAKHVSCLAGPDIWHCGRLCRMSHVLIILLVHTTCSIKLVLGSLSGHPGPVVGIRGRCDKEAHSRRHLRSAVGKEFLHLLLSIECIFMGTTNSTTQSCWHGQESLIMGRLGPIFKWDIYRRVVCVQTHKIIIKIVRRGSRRIGDIK